LDREDFISGWLAEDGTVLGRPVDILVLPEGLAYISDDRAGVIYRLEYRG
jgi:glucose/arabinose dehydrogenase